MLRLRILSALILVPLVIWGVLRLDLATFAAALALVLALAAWEWVPLIPLNDGFQRLAYVATLLLVLALVWTQADNDVLVRAVIGSAMLTWLLILFWIASPTLGAGDTPLHAAFKAVLGVALLVSTWLALVVLHSRPDAGPRWVLFLLFLIWTADSGAYFTGRQWGRTRLAPVVSPGKTWEGVLGAMTACTLFALGYGHFIGMSGTLLTGFVLVCLVTVLFSVAGDLLESLLKRHRGVKDSGTLIPGHGGILDRIDSLLAAAPVFVFGMQWVGL